MKVGMCTATARKYIVLGLLPSQVRVPHTWRTRVDAFADVREDLLDMLEVRADLPATMALDFLKCKYPERFNDGMLRTLQRRFRHYRAEYVAKELFFEQVHEPGQWLQIDWVRAHQLGVFIADEPFSHLFCHAVLPFSNVEWAVICEGETFDSLHETLRETANRLGGLPAGLQLDNSSAVTHREGAERVFNTRFERLLEHYELQGRTTNIRCPNENGDVESSHRHFKEMLDMALSLRGSRHFESLEQYQQFVIELLYARNEKRAQRFSIELPCLKAPRSAARQFQRTVDKGGLVKIDSAAYSLPSSYVGERVTCHIDLTAVRFFYNGREIRTSERSDEGTGVYWRDLIGSLARKPGAMAGYTYRAALFPSTLWQLFYDKLGNLPDVERHDAVYLQLLGCAALIDDTLGNTVIALLLLDRVTISVALFRGLTMALQGKRLLGSNIALSPAHQGAKATSPSPVPSVLPYLAVCDWIRLSHRSVSLRIDKLSAVVLALQVDLPPVVPQLSLGTSSLVALLGEALTNARIGELQNDAALHQSIDGGHAQHGVLENAVPLTEHQVAAEHHAAPLVPRREKQEEHLHLVSSVLAVAQFVDHDHIKTVEPLQLLLQAQLFFGLQQPFDQHRRTHIEHAELMAQDQLPTQGFEQMRLAAPRQAQSHQILRAVDKITIDETGQNTPDLLRPQLRLGRLEGFLRSQARLLEQTLCAAMLSILILVLAQVSKKLPITPVLGFGLEQCGFDQCGNAGEAERLEVHRQTFIVVHCSSPLKVHHKRSDRVRMVAARAVAQLCLRPHESPPRASSRAPPATARPPPARPWARPVPQH